MLCGDDRFQQAGCGAFPCSMRPGCSADGILLPGPALFCLEVDSLWINQRRAALVHGDAVFQRRVAHLNAVTEACIHVAVGGSEMPVSHCQPRGGKLLPSPDTGEFCHVGLHFHDAGRSHAVRLDDAPGTLRWAGLGVDQHVSGCGRSPAAALDVGEGSAPRGHLQGWGYLAEQFLRPGYCPLLRSHHPRVGDFTPTLQPPRPQRHMDLRQLHRGRGHQLHRYLVPKSHQCHQFLGPDQREQVLDHRHRGHLHVPQCRAGDGCVGRHPGRGYVWQGSRGTK